ncbi:MAG: bifunctional precorrin-2 dehydrogenase/sirohydrochlorin ferrochelatase [Candidatus Latescibacterota bacterium]|nr:MAG: bifunctional precorrin-2 dehydrogenase/sirohydrochlorin ferrochelatase [Candidatus Latescibacterota bacterium]
MTNKYMPISVSLSDRPCLVVGGGAVALRKVETLLDYDADITVVAPEVHEKLEYHAERKRLSLERREYRSPEAAEYGLVISASDDTALNRQVYEDAKKGDALVNVVDDPPHCDFIFPAVLRRDCLTAAISTDGKAPFVAGHLRMVLENIFPTHWNRLMSLAANFRKRVRARWAGDMEKMNACYAEFLEADWKLLLKEKSDDGIEEELSRMLELRK